MTENNKRSKALNAWLYFAAVTVIIGVIMLYPIGRVIWDVLFIVIKVGMLAGIIAVMKKRDMKSLAFWAVFSGLAVIMSIIKWQLNGVFVWTYALAMATDIVVPFIGYLLLKAELKNN